MESDAQLTQDREPSSPAVTADLAGGLSGAGSGARAAGRGGVDLDRAARASLRIASTGTLPETVIVPHAPWQLVDLVQLWRARDLILMLSVRDLKVRYKQTIVGVAWVVMQPLLTMMIFYVLFKVTSAKPISGKVPFVLSAFCGLVLWQVFASALTRATTSLVDHQALLKKVWCPRLVFPLAPVCVALVDFLIGLMALGILMAAYRHRPGVALLAMPLFVLLCALTAAAAGIWTSALAARYRDLVFAVPFLVQIWLLVTPVLYETGSVIHNRRLLPIYYLNPMAGIIEGFRWSVLGTSGAGLPYVLISVTSMGVLLVSGLAHFRNVEETLADVV